MGARSRVRCGRSQTALPEGGFAYQLDARVPRVPVGSSGRRRRGSRFPVRGTGCHYSCRELQGSSMGSVAIARRRRARVLYALYEAR